MTNLVGEEQHILLSHKREQAVMVTPLYGRRDKASARWLSADLIYEGLLSMFHKKHIQKYWRSQLIQSLFALRPVHNMAKTCMLSVITCK